jgi:hypothetical protein
MVTVTATRRKLAYAGEIKTIYYRKFTLAPWSGTDSSDNYELDPSIWDTLGDWFQPKGWKSVRHGKVSGTIFLNPHVQISTRPDGVHVGKITQGTVYGTHGDCSDDGVIVVPQGISYYYLHFNSSEYTRVWVFNYYAPGECAYYAWRIDKANRYGKTVWREMMGLSNCSPSWDYLPKITPWERPSLEDAVTAQIDASVAAVSRCRCYQKWRTATGTLTVQQPIGKYDVECQLRRYLCMAQAAGDTALSQNLPNLHATAFDGVNKFDGNMLAFCSELSSFGTTGIKSLYDLANSSLTRKDLASFWLSNRYGDRLSFRDAKELCAALDSSFLTVKPKTSRFIGGKSRSSASIPLSGEQINCRLGCEVAVTPRDYNALMRAVRHAYEWDYYPTLGNVWDMIPMSFVVDWFLNVGEIYESVDRMVQARYYDVAATLQSVKAEFAPSQYPGIKVSYYHRYVGHSLKLGVSSVKLGLPSAINVIDGISLVCSV